MLFRSSKVLDFFGIPAVHETEEATEGGATASEETAQATVSEHNTEPTVSEHNTEPTISEHNTGVAVAPKGAIFMAPDNDILSLAHEAPKWVKVSPFIAMLLGLFTAYMFYIRHPDWPGRLAANQRPLYLFLLNKWYFDELYDWAFIRPAKWLGNFLWKRGDGNIMDGTLNGIAMGIVPFFTRLAGRSEERR